MNAGQRCGSNADLAAHFPWVSDSLEFNQDWPCIDREETHLAASQALLPVSLAEEAAYLWAGMHLLKG